MNGKMTYIFAIIIITITVFNLSAQDVPSIINYQGFITDKDGKALNGNDFTIVFSLYDRPEGGDPLWHETHAAVSVENGMLNVLLGSVDSTFNGEILAGKRFLGIKVGAENELSPRMQLASVPYSLRTDHSGSADSAAHALQSNKALALDAPDGGPENAVFVDKDGNIEVAGRIKDKTGFIMPVGTVLPFAGNDTTAIEGWLICDGKEVNRIKYADLFAVIGVGYGAGDQVSTFKLPDLRTRMPVGMMSGNANFGQMGGIGGEEEVTLSTDQIPAHNHYLEAGHRNVTLLGNTGGSLFDYDAGGGRVFNDPLFTVQTTQNAGGGQSHNNLQPYIVMNYIIKY